MAKNETIELDDKFLNDCERWAVTGGLRCDATHQLTGGIRALKKERDNLRIVVNVLECKIAQLKKRRHALR